jgi:hypothetical protein
VQAVLRSGVAFTMLRVKGLNEHPGGKFPAGSPGCSYDLVLVMSDPCKGFVKACKGWTMVDS